VRESVRYIRPMRAHRAYLAGFGSSGSLLAGAAALFVVASAIIAFHGWPQVATGPASTDVAAPRAAGGSPATRRLAILTSRRLAALRRLAAGRTAASASGTPGRVGPSPATGGGAPAGRTVNASTTGGRGGGVTTASACGPSGCGTAGPQNVIASLTGTVTRDVSNIGTSVGSQLSGSARSVAGKLEAVSPQAASTVDQAGSAAAGAVSSTAGAASGTVAHLGAAAGVH
jgi:trimeric autotransporter adhesin